MSAWRRRPGERGHEARLVLRAQLGAPRGPGPRDEATEGAGTVRRAREQRHLCAAWKSTSAPSVQRPRHSSRSRAYAKIRSTKFSRRRASSEPPLLFDWQVRKAADKRGREQACRALRRRHAGIDVGVHLHALHAAAGRLRTRARSRTAPRAPARRPAPPRTAACARSSPAPVPSPTIRGPGPTRSAISRTLSRGTPIPTSTSGQTDTYSTSGPSSSTRNVSRLCCPSKRTFAPSKHAETPRRNRGACFSRADCTAKT